MKKSRFAVLVSMIVACLFSLVTASLAWFLVQYNIPMDSAQGYTAASYFARGDGSKDDPYVINSPIHLYNLAWLQYLGEFNTDTDSDGNYVQYYFELDDEKTGFTELDMTGLVLPPIGTTTYPFIGNFNGNGKTISNLTVSNEISSDGITKKPLKVNADNFRGVNIVGVFGVVGDIDSTYAGHYSTAVNSVEDVYIKNATVSTSLSESLIGIAAGYVNGILDGIGVVDSKIDVVSSTNTYGSFSDDLSDYTVVGYCTDNYKTTFNKNTTTISNVDSSTAKYTYKGTDGDSTGWGGSVDMMSMYTRLRDIYTNSSVTDSDYPYTKTIYNYADGNISVTTGSSSFTYKSYNSTHYSGTYDEKIGNFVFNNNYTQSSYSSGNYVCLYGGTDVTTTTQYYTGETETKTGYKIYDESGNYLSNSSTSLSKGTSSSYVLWTVNGTIQNNGSVTISTTINSAIYYLSYTSSGSGRNKTYTPSLSTTSRAWTLTSSGSGYYLSVTADNSSRYLYLSGSSYSLSTSSRTLWNFEETTETIQKTAEYDPVKTVVYDDTNSCYFPLSTTSSTDYTPSDTNTGYVIAGGTEKGDLSSRKSDGDIRVSRFDSSRLTGLSSGSLGTVYTFDEDGTRRTISTSDTSFTKYSDSKTSLESILSSSDSYIYGLHFMKSTISDSALVTASYAKINNQEKSNYEMPVDSIDCTLKTKGYVNFFAGTYYSGNNSFFSVNEVFRDSNDKITDIKEIKEMYSDGVANHSYIYKYADGTYSTPYVILQDKSHGDWNTLVGTYSGDYPDAYSKVYSTSVFSKKYTDTSQFYYTSNNSTYGYAYYFEFPMNDGEFALGSVSDGTGAYLMYLDISANAVEIDRTILTQKMTIDIKTYQYPNGVAIVATTSTTIDAAVTAVASIQVGASGEITASRATSTTSDVVTFTGSETKRTSSYISEDVVAKNGSTDMSAIPISTKTQEIEQVTYIDYNQSTLAATYTTITKTTIDGTSSTEYTVKYADGTDAEDQNIYDDEGNVITLDSISIDTSSCTDTVFSFSFTYSKDGTFTAVLGLLSGEDPENGTEKYYVFTGNNVTITSSEDITIKITLVNGSYVLEINGTEYAQGDEVTVAGSTGS